MASGIMEIGIAGKNILCIDMCNAVTPKNNFSMPNSGTQIRD